MALSPVEVSGCLDVCVDDAMTEMYNDFENEQRASYGVDRFYNATDEGYEGVFIRILKTAARAKTDLDDFRMNKTAALMQELGFLPPNVFDVTTTHRGKVDYVRSDRFTGRLSDYLTDPKTLGEFIQKEGRWYRLRKGVDERDEHISRVDVSTLQATLEYLFFALWPRLQEIGNTEIVVGGRGKCIGVDRALAAFLELVGEDPTYHELGIQSAAQLIEQGLDDLANQKAPAASKRFDEATQKCIVHEKLADEFIRIFVEMGADLGNPVFRRMWPKIGILPKKSRIREICRRVAFCCTTESQSGSLSDDTVSKVRKCSKLLRAMRFRPSVSQRHVTSGNWWVAFCDLRDSKKLEAAEDPVKEQKCFLVGIGKTLGDLMGGHLVQAPPGDAIVYAFSDEDAALKFCAWYGTLINEIGLALQESRGIDVGVGCGVANGQLTWDEGCCYAHGQAIDQAEQASKGHKGVRVKQEPESLFETAREENHDPSDLFQRYFLNEFLAAPSIPEA
jgi:hypothetical protein